MNFNQNTGRSWKKWHEGKKFEGPFSDKMTKSGVTFQSRNNSYIQEER